MKFGSQMRQRLAITASIRFTSTSVKSAWTEELRSTLLMSRIKAGEGAGCPSSSAESAFDLVCSAGGQTSYAAAGVRTFLRERAVAGGSAKRENPKNI